MGALLFDLGDAVRSLRHRPAYAVTVILTFALTVGGTTAVFSVVDGVLLRPLAYTEPERLITVREVWHEVLHLAPTLEANERHFEFWRQHATTLESAAQYSPAPANLRVGGNAFQASVARTSSALFDVLGVDPALGRVLTAADEDGAAAPVAVISDALWRKQFGATPAAVGATIVIDGRPSTIAGVLPASFRLPARGQLLDTVDAFVPLTLRGGWAGEHNHMTVARLRPGIAIEAARAELDLLQAQVAAIASRESGQTVTLSAVVTPLGEAIVGRSRRGLLMLLAAIGAVLVIACANLANLALARALDRGGESAVRVALGAGRLRLVRRVVFEQTALAVVGSGAGLAVAAGALRVFAVTAPVDLPRLHDVTLDGRVAGFAALVGVVAGLAVALVPSWQIASNAHTATGQLRPVVGDRVGMRTRRWLLALQIGVAVTLLVVTGLVGSSLARVLGVDRQFTAKGVVVVPVSLSQDRYPGDDARIAVLDRLLVATAALPGVTSVSTTSLLPMRGEGQVNFVVPAGRVLSGAERPSANYRFVDPNYFATLDLPLQRGRSFARADRDGRRLTPVVVSASLVRRLWPGDNPLGREFSRGVDGEPGFEIVGVAVDAQTTSADTPPPDMVYLPYWWQPRLSASLLVQTAQAPDGVVAMVRRAVADVDPQIAIGRVERLDDIVASATAGRWYQVRLFVAFGACAAAIATLGVYSVAAFAIARRRREMNLRIALGAPPSAIFGLLFRDTGAGVAAGIAAGLLGALLLGNAVAGVLYAVSPRDPLVLVTVAAGIAVSALATIVVAWRRELCVDPAAALRAE